MGLVGGEFGGLLGVVVELTGGGSRVVVVVEQAGGVMFERQSEVVRGMLSEIYKGSNKFSSLIDGRLK